MCDRCVQAGRMTEAEAAQQRDEMLGALGMLLGGYPSGDTRRIAVEEAVQDFLSALTGLGYTLGFRDGDKPGTVILGAIPGDTRPGEKSPGVSIAEWSVDQFREMFG